MEDEHKTKEQLLHEPAEMRTQNAVLKKSISGNISADLAADATRCYADNILESLRDPILVLNEDLKIISANPSFHTTFKTTPDETIGSFIYDLKNQQFNIPKLKELLEEVIPEKKAFDDFEITHDFQDIGHKVLLLNAREIFRKDIGTKVILLAFEDITENKRLEDLLTDSEERYRRLFETANDGIVLLEKGQGKITHANPAFEEMLGYNKKDLIDRDLQDIIFLPDLYDFQTRMQVLDKEGIIKFDDVPVTTKSGQHIDTEMYLVDRAKLVQCNIREITERKRQEERRRQENKFLDLMVDNLPIMLFLKDAQELKYIRFNRAGENLLGYSRDDLLGRNDYDFLTKEQADYSTSMDIEALRGGKIVDIPEEPIQTHRGERILHTRKVPIFNAEGEPAYLLVISRDITDHKQAEESLKETLELLRKALGTTIQALASAVELRDPYTSGHQNRAADLARTIALEMELPRENIEALRLAGPIHDIGKLSVPSDLLSKPTRLSEIEFSLIREHSQIGYELLKHVESPWPLAEIVYQHHERMDGSGYPRNLQGDEILMESRIMAVGDVVEAMASHRPYRPALGVNVALEEIEKNKGKLYDADVVDACLRLFREKDYQFPERA